ncbi:MAG: NAD(P)-dependent oxidoreductase [Thermoleophilia bacterium]|nr:NAD(P)-dependent oxidoreductase [Thermoleophilia bacterium]
MPKTLEGKTILMSGGSRGIGLAIAVRAARDGANVAVMAKTDQPHPKLPGTIHTAVEEIEAAGGKGLGILGDVRDDASIEDAVGRAVDAFGGIDICLNNASAINLAPTPDLDPKRYDLMQDINTRGTFMLSRACIPHLERSANAHILTLSPPINLAPRWAGGQLGYTIAKYGMSLCTLGLAEELKDRPIAANSLWPRTLIATAAVQNLLGGEQSMNQARTPEIVADAAHTILVRSAAECSGNFFIDDEVLADEGVTDLSSYQAGEGEPLLDLFLDG